METEQNKHAKLLVINSYDVLERRLICFHATKVKASFGGGVDKVQIEAVEEVWYRHPQAPEDAKIPVIETRFIASYPEGSLEAGALETLEAADRSVLNQVSRDFYFKRHG